MTAARPSRTALRLAFAARRCRCGAPACAVVPGADPVRECGIVLAAGRSDRNRCLKHLDERVPTREEADRVRALAARLGYDADEPVRLPPEPTDDDVWPCPDDVWP